MGRASIFFLPAFTFSRNATQRSAAVADKTGMSKNIKPTRSAPPVDPTLAQTAPAAFALVRAEVEAVPVAALTRVNLDMARSARRGLAVAERIEPLHPILAKLVDLDFHAVSRLRPYALAVLHTDELANEGGGPAARLPALLAEATPLRALMLCGAELLALAGFVSHERVAAIRSGQGYADTASDVQALGRMYLELWDRVHDKVPVTRAMVERSITLSAELNEALGVREIGEDHPLAEPSGPARLRAKAFSLFLRSYDECRRGVSYLRWHHADARVIVPSLYPRAPRRKVPDEVSSGEQAPEDRVGASGREEPEGEPTPESELGGVAGEAAENVAAQ